MKSPKSFVVVAGTALVAYMAGWMSRGSLVSSEGKAEGIAPMTGGSQSPGAKEIPASVPRRPAKEESVPVIESQEEGADPAMDRAGLLKLLSRTDREFAVKLAEWTRAFGLTEAQRQQLQALEAKRRAGIEAAWSEGGLDPAANLSELGGQPLDEALKGLLDPTQAAAYQEWQVAKGEQQSRSRATARLAELENLTLLTEDQRQAVYAKFQDPAAAESGALPSGAAGAVDTEFLKAVSARMGEGGGTDFAKTAGTLVRENIEKQVGALTGILQPEQIEAYRLSLESRYAAWLMTAP